MFAFFSGCGLMVLVFMVYVGHVSGQRATETTIWTDCVAKREMTVKDTQFKCEPISGKLNGQTITFPK